MKIVSWTVLLIAISTGTVTIRAQECISKDRQSSKPGSVRYVIHYNKVDPGENKSVPDSRYIELFADEESFSEVNVREMLVRVSRRYPAPKLIHVNIFTDLRDVENPEEREMPKKSESSKETQQWGDQAVATIKGREALYYLYYKNGDFVEGSCSLP